MSEVVGGQSIEEIEAELGADLPAEVEVVPSEPMAHLLIQDKFEHLVKVAGVFAKCSFLPKSYAGNGANCLVALHMAHTLKCDPLLVMQNSYVVHGKLGFEGKFAIAMMNTRGPFDGAVKFDLKGKDDDRQCIAKARRKGEKSYVSSPAVSIRQAKAMGWYSQNANWKNNPDLMLQYRAATYLCRLHCPELLMGMQTTDELKDVGPKKPGAERIDAMLENMRQEG